MNLEAASDLLEKYPSEKSEALEPDTGLRVIRWTASESLDRPLYFTSQSVTADDRWLVFLSERDGHPNFYRIDRCSGNITRLTDNREGSLASYCYPSDNWQGLGKSSPCLDSERKVLFYIQANVVWRICLETLERVRLFSIPSGWWTAFTHISPDGRLLCVPCTPPEAFPSGQTTQWEQLDTVPQRLAELGHRTRLYLVDTATGEARILTEMPLWVTHVNFMPDNSGRLLANSEGMASFRTGRPPRIWCVEADGTYRPLFDQPEGMQVNHENFTRAQNWVVYHGVLTRDEVRHKFVSARHWDGSLVYESLLRDTPLMHATAMNDPYASVIDGPESISVVRFGEDGQVSVRSLCHHHAREGFNRNQDHHPHPLQTPDGRGVVFCSNRHGEGDVYEVRLDPAEA